MVKGKGPNNEEMALSEIKIEAEDQDERGSDPEISKLDMVAKVDMDMVFSRLDTNKDGLLTKEEFIEGCLKDPEILRSRKPNEKDSNES